MKLKRETVRCADCRLDVDPLRAAFSCPLFSRDRRGVERECVSFVPKTPQARTRDLGQQSAENADRQGVKLDDHRPVRLNQ